MGIAALDARHRHARDSKHLGATGELLPFVAYSWDDDAFSRVVFAHPVVLPAIPTRAGQVANPIAHGGRCQGIAVGLLRLAA